MAVYIRSREGNLYPDDPSRMLKTGEARVEINMEAIKSVEAPTLESVIQKAWSWSPDRRWVDVSPVTIANAIRTAFPESGL